MAIDDAMRLENSVGRSRVLVHAVWVGLRLLEDHELASELHALKVAASQEYWS